MIRKAGADQAFLTLEAYKAMEKIAQGNATKIIIPSELQGIVGLASGLIESLQNPAAPASTPKK
jgi:hypothetical protein